MTSNILPPVMERLPGQPAAGARTGTWRVLQPFLLLLALAASAPAEAPVRLTTQHVDLRVRYEAQREWPLDLVASDDDAHPRRDLEATNCVLMVAEASKVLLPGDFPPLGVAGDPLWILPASQEEGLLYLGLSGEGVASGVFEGPLQLQLLGVEGPGHFFLWQAEFGALRFWMNSRDGFGPDDAFEQLVGGHSHANFGFTTSGVYRLTFQAVGRRAGETTNLVSQPTTFRFEVLPLPPEVVRPFDAWRQEHWPGIVEEAVVGSGANPDGDPFANLLEYVLLLDPKSPDDVSAGAGAPAVSVIGTGASAQAQVRMSRAARATDVDYLLQTADHVAGPWTTLDVVPTVVPEVGDRVMVSFLDPRPVAQRALALYRVELRLNEQP